jgi:uroporphyrinogen decarboxylase
MTSLQRVLTTLGHREPDRVPLFLLPTMHGARELGLSIREYFSRAEYVVEGQVRLRQKYQHDCIYTFFYAPIEVEAWGAEVIYTDDGPPNSGEPLLRDAEEILRLSVPDVSTTPCLLKVLRATELLNAAVGDDAPIIGVVMSPFSLPVMQLGFEIYLRVLHERLDLFQRLMQINMEFCVQWANAQIAAGATAICYFDPVSSPTMLPPEMYRRTGREIAQQTIRRFHGPTAIHLASGHCAAILDDVALSGAAVVGTSCFEDLAELKRASAGRLTLLGNLNGIEMARWSAAQAEQAVKRAIAKAGPGGGYIVSDTHGEIPFQVPDQVLTAIAEAVRAWGTYPLTWIEAYDG